MGFRIDNNVTERFNDPAGQTATPITEQQKQKFQGAIQHALEARAENGGPGQVREGQERLFVVEKGDSFARIAEQNDVSYDELLKFNNRSDIPNPDRIDPGDVVFVPNTSPKAAAASPRDAKGVPEGEETLAGNLYDRGNALEYADNPAAVDYPKETQALAGDVRDYLQALPANQRQDAALRLVTRDWRDAGPAGEAVKQAVKAEGLSADPEAVTAQRLYDRGNKLEYTDHPSPADLNPDTNGLAATVRDYLGLLPEGQRQGALQRLYDRDWRDAGPVQLAIEQVAKRDGITLAATTHASPDVDAQARSIIDTAKGQKPVDALRTLTNGLTGATPELQKALLHNPDTQKIISDAANWANEPLNQDPANGRTGEQAPGAGAAGRLEALTAPYKYDGQHDRSVDPRLGVDLLNAAAPRWEQFNDHYQRNFGNSMLGMQGMHDLMAVSDRVYDAEGGQQAVARFAEMGHYDRNGIFGALSEGVGPAYALEYIRAHAADLNVKDQLDFITSGMETYAGNNVRPRAQDFAQHHEELSWLVANYGPSMTPDQRDAAINDYIKSHPGFEKESQRKEDALAEKGSTMVHGWNQLRAFADSMPANDPDVRAMKSHLADFAADPEISAGATAAIRNRPELLEGANGISTLNTMDMLQSASNTARSVNAARKLGQEAVTFYMKQRIENFVNAKVPDDVARANLLQGMREGVIAKLLGVSNKHYNMAVDALESAILSRNAPPELRNQRLAELNQKLENINNTMDGVKSFSRFTFPGQLMRVAGLALSGVTAAFTSGRAITDPTVFTAFKGAVDAVGMVQKVADFALGRSGEETEGWLAKFGGTGATRLFGALTAVGDFGMSVQYLMRHDPTAATLSGVMGAGGLTWALGTSAWSGPVGFGLVLVGAIGLELWNKHKESTKFETQTSADFLAHAGLSREAADALKDQSGDGFSPVPILLRYGELHHLNPQQTIAWINSVANGKDGADKLATLRDNLHHTLDDIDGDVSKFGQTADDDASYIADSRDHDGEFIPPDGYAPAGDADIVSGDSSPSSAAQVDAALDTLGIDRPRA